MTPETVGKHKLIELFVDKDEHPWNDEPKMTAKVKTANGRDAVLPVHVKQETGYRSRNAERVELDISGYAARRELARGITRVADVPDLREKAIAARANHNAKFVPTSKELTDAAKGKGVAKIGPTPNYSGDSMWYSVTVELDGFTIAGVSVVGTAVFDIDTGEAVYNNRNAGFTVKHVTNVRDDRYSDYRYNFPDRHRAQVGAMLKPFVDSFLAQPSTKKAIRAFEDENLARELKSAERDIVEEQAALDNTRAKVKELKETIAKRKAEVDNA